MGLRLTTEYIWADVSWASSLVLQQVVLADQVFSQAEVSDGDSVGPESAQIQVQLVLRALEDVFRCDRRNCTNKT